MLSPFDKGKQIHSTAKQRREISRQHLQTGSELVVLTFEQNVERGKRSVTERDVLLQLDLVRFVQFVARASGILRIVHCPREKIMAATTTVGATRIPDSPIHSVAPAPVLAGSNAFWIMAFQAACNAIAGQTLPVSKRSRA